MYVNINGVSNVMACFHHRLLTMAEAFETGARMTMDDRRGHGSDSRDDRWDEPLGGQHRGMGLYIPNRYPDWDGGSTSQGTSRPPGGLVGYQLQPSTVSNPMMLLAEAVVSRRAMSPGVQPSPESPERPEDHGELPDEDQPTAVVPPTARSSPPGPPCLNLSVTDNIYISRFLTRPFEYYTRLDDLLVEIGRMQTKFYIALKKGLSATARQQIQRIRRQAYYQRHERNVKRLQRELEAMAHQLDCAHRTAFSLRRELGRLQDLYGRSQDTVAQLHHASSVLVRFCRNRLQQQDDAIQGVEMYLQRRVNMGGPPPTPRDSPPREQPAPQPVPEDY